MLTSLEIPNYDPDVRCVILFCGLPASGKTSAARELVTSDPNRWKRINRDDVRLMLHGPSHDYTNKSHEKAVTEVCNAALRELLENGVDVVLDNTFLDGRSRKAIHQIAEEHGECVVIEKVFEVPVEECLRRNALRSGIARVPESVILGMAKKASVAKDGRIGQLCDSVTLYSSEGNYGGPELNDPSLPTALVVDLDGTLCLHNGRNPYDASRCEEDLVNQPVLDVLEQFNDFVIFMSGRSDKYRPETERWLKKYVPNYVLTAGLFMRAEGDMRKDSIVKRELFEKHVAGKYRVRFVMDDRNSVVKEWRRLGLTCFQVAEGNF
jgi:predicted kinase